MLKTAAAPRTQRLLLAVAMGRRPSVAIVWRTPTRLSPPIWMISRSNPAAGTSLASRPCSVPTKQTLWPRVRSSWATASPGITCPPVPPPAIRKLRSFICSFKFPGNRSRPQRGTPVAATLWGSLVGVPSGSGRLSIGPLSRLEPSGGGNQPPRRLSTCPTSNVRIPYSSRVLADVHQHSEARQGADQAAAAVADHGERDALGGHHPQHHAHVHEALDYHDHGQAQGEIASEIVVDAQGGADAAPENHGETEQQSDGADHAQLFAGHRVNEILVGFREVEEFLAAAHETEAEGAAGADGDLGLLELVVGVAGDQRLLEPGFNGALPIEFFDDLELRVEEHHHAGQAIGLGENEKHQAYHG